MRTLIRAGLITLAALTLAAAHGAPVARTQLPNGLTVIAAPSDVSRIAGIAVVVGSSMADEPEGLRGARVMLQQLIVLGSHEQINEQLSPVSSFIDPRSSGLGVNTEWEFVEATLAVHVEELDVGLQLLAGQLFGAQITPERFDEARELVKRGYDISHESPVQDTFDLFRRAFYGAHPMAESLQGDPESIDAMSLEGLQAFRDASYVASNAVVCVVAPMPAEEITAAVTAAFGALPARPAPPPVAGPAPPADARVEVGDAPGLAQASMVVGVPLPPIDDPRYVAGEVLGQLLDGRGGRLRRDLSLLQTLGLAIPTRLLEQHYPIG
ncbi:MAG TPA: insulinase family protein, partial [Thioalkalivibrio sp.]|nr:insulinase family protein [Thioalkalivibrio sp.]